MKILIDADACPVVAQTAALAKKYSIECIAFCDTSHELSQIGIRCVTVSKGSDSADFALVNTIVCGDIVVTQDYGLAAMCLGRGAFPIRQDGLIYDDSNIDSLLHSRYLNARRRRSGIRIKGPKKRTEKDDQMFAKSLETLILRLFSEKD